MLAPSVGDRAERLLTRGTHTNYVPRIKTMVRATAAPNPEMRYRAVVSSRTAADGRTDELYEPALQLASDELAEKPGGRKFNSCNRSSVR
ncbi:hypothetical protein EVAR_25716_1 [Eumeta japonica]|uniref:Uncharacterized protein n=1 Tax=Eumeta variegata TaxID=151549 RepID=A0A4C1YT72_EUMVA|nr:hypothetical protein EVAR_25716_1 [Eumeta japonica]